METIIAAVISSVGTLGVCLITNHFQAAKTRALLDYRLGQLEKKQDKHNKVIERVYHLETEIEVVREQIKVGNHRIEDLEKIT